MMLLHVCFPRFIRVDSCSGLPESVVITSGALKAWTEVDFCVL